MEQLHEHNQKTYENICRMYGEGIQRVAVVQPTGSGKSLLMAKLIEDNPNSRFFVLSTRHEINEQFKEKLDEKILKRIDFNIYCNMPNMKQEIMESLQPDYIFLDEMHRALAKEWSKGIMRLLEMYPDAKVLGLSATPIRYLDRCRNVVEELFGGNLACDMSLSEAILDGILPMARYVCGVYSYEKDAESLNKKIERSCNSNEEKKDLLRQVKILKENLDKGHGVSDIFRKYIVSGSEKFVVFLKDTTHLRVMKPVIEKWFTDAGFPVRLFEVHSKNTDKDKEFQKFKEDTEDGIIKACLSVNIVTEGIHGDIDGVIMLRDTISPNMYFQMIGRAFSCGKKTIPLIFDLVANSQFISDAADNFPNELRGEIEKRKKECEKEGKEYEVGFDVDEFIVMDEFMDVVSGFREIEGRLEGSWENGLKHFDKYVREHNGDVLVPENYKDEGGFCTGNWVSRQRSNFKNKKLSIDKIDELNKKGFIWDVKEFYFNKYFDALKQYKDREGNCFVPQKHVEIIGDENINLGQWCLNVRGERRNKNGNYILTEEMENQLTKVGFIWEPYNKYNFENSIIAVANYCKEFGKYPSQHSQDCKVKRLGAFVVQLRQNMRKDNFPEWKNALIKKYVPDFSCEHNNIVALKRFLHYARLYKKENGHLNIKINDVVGDDYRIGIIFSAMRQKYKNGQFKNSEVRQIEELGLYLGSKFNKQYNEKMECARQAVRDGVKINVDNQFYNKINLYTWIKSTINKKYKNGELSDEENLIIEKLIDKPLGKFFNNGTYVKVVDVINKEEISICKSRSDVSRIVQNVYGFKLSDESIRNRLSGKVTTPYKGRFMFYYATDEEVKKYLEDGKQDNS